jgi:hypothetical protein
MKEEKKEEEKVQPKLMVSDIPIHRKCEACENEERAQAKLFRLIQCSEDTSPSIDIAEEEASADRKIDRKHISLHHPDVIQRSGRGPPGGIMQFEQNLSSTKGQGSALPASTQQFMESRFNADFSGVRIHTSSYAENLSSTIHAQAFTHGSDIYFNNGKYSPNTADGSLLLAHELTHTIQQGASKTNSIDTTLNTSVSRKNIIQRSPDNIPPQLNNAVEKAKTVEGKINANKEGADGFREGWQHLVEIFKTTMGEDKIISGSGGSVQGAVSEADIKKKRIVTGKPPANPRPSTNGPYERDAMPSWCGIFVFWALNKSGVPMHKWELGGRNIKPEAAYAPGYIPHAGDIAYRNAYSHFAIVESSTGTTVKSVNGNTAGEDNLGGQVQTREHPLTDWTAFFDPLKLMSGSLGSGEGPIEEKPKTLRELRRELFNVNRKEDDGLEEENIHEENDTAHETPEVQSKPELSTWSVDSSGKLKTNTSTTSHVNDKNLPRKEEEKKAEEDKLRSVNEPVIQKKRTTTILCKQTHETDTVVSSDGYTNASPQQEYNISSLKNCCDGTTAVMSSEQDRGPPSVQRSTERKIQCGWFDDALSVVSSAIDYVAEGLEAGKRLLLNEARDFAMAIPGYRALRVVLGEDPITGEVVERNGRNFIEAAFDIMPGGRLLHQKLEELGALDEAAAWIDVQITRVEALVSNIVNRIEQFWNALTIDSLAHPTQIFEDAGNIIHGFIQSVIDFAVEAATELLETVKRFLLTQIVDFIRNHTTAYPLLQVILGQDPITEQPVERNGTNILNALLELGGEEGRQQRAQMQDTGTFRKVADWIDRGIAVFGNLYQTIRNNFGLIWGMVSIESLMHPIDTFNRIYDMFAEPVRQVWDFVRDTARIILQFIKEVLLRRLSAWARTVRGYHLVTVLIGRDPFTDEAVPRTIPNIIRGFMSLMEGGEDQYQQLEQSGAIARTTQQISAAVARLNMTPASIVQLFIDLWNSFSLNDLAHPIEAFRRIINRFGEPIARLIAFVVEIIKIVIHVILEIMNFPFDLINNIIAKAMKSFELIKRDPVGFLKNLLRAIKEGFIQFFDNILTHLINGLVGWLTMELKDAGVPELKDLSLKGIISWVLEILGISMEKIWEKLAAHPRIGPAKVAKIRSLINTLTGIWTFIKDVQERGVAAIWDKIQEQLSNLWNVVLDAVKNWIMEKIITQVTVKLLSMLDPTGIMAVINSAIALYKAVQSFIKYLRQMLEIVNSFVEGVAEIASGNTKKAADFLERTLARGVPIVIGFLANQVGLTGIGKRIGEMIEKAREMVDKAISWLVNKAVDTAFAVIDKIIATGKAVVGAVAGWLGFRERFTTVSGEDHTAYIRQTGDVVRLIIESTPVDIITFFNQKQMEITANASLPEAEKNRLSGRITHGKNLSQGLNALMNNEATKNDPRIPSMISEVIAIIREIDPGGSSVMPPATPVISPAYSMGVKATSFSAMYLHKGGAYRDRNGNMVTVPKNHGDGSEPTDAALTQAFQLLTDMRLNNRWVRFHILNADFGGLGVDSNLIPTPNYINNPEYLHELENPVKGFYNSGLPIWLRASITYRTNILNGVFVNTYSAQAGAMKFQNNQWVEDSTKQRTFNKSIDAPESNSFNINQLIADPSNLTLLVNMTTVTTAMFEILRDNQPSGGYTYYRQMERVIARTILGPDPISLDDAVIDASSVSNADKRRARDYKNRLGSANWTF